MQMLDVAVGATNKSKPVQDASESAQDVLRSAWRKSYPGLAAIGVFSVFINLLKLATPLYVLQILDRVISSRSHETLIMLTIIVLLAVISGLSLEVVRRRMFMHWGSWIERSFGPKLFTVGLQKSASPSQASSASKMLRDVANIRSFVSGSGLIAWLDVIWAPLFIACVFLISPPLAYIVLIAVLIALVLGTMYELLTRNSRDATYKAGKDYREWVSSAERNRETVGTLDMAANLAEQWSRSAFTRLDEGMRTRILNIYFEAALRFVGRCLRISILCVGLWLVIDQQMAFGVDHQMTSEITLGAVIAAKVLGGMAYKLAQSAMSKWGDMMTARRAYERIKTSLIKETSRPVSMLKSSTPVPLFIEKVSYRYPHQASPVLRGIEMTLKPGEVLCVMGESAMGKTTFWRLVSGLISPRSGSIRLGDVDVFRLQQHSARRIIGHLPQEVALFPGTVRENIARMAKGNIRQVIRAAKLAGIHETILKLPQGYDTEIAEDEPLLSAGQRKQITIARAYYGTPPLIVMDEPTPHLDEPARLALFNAILRWKKRGMIVVLTTQSNALSRIADKIILLKSTKAELLRTREEVAAFGSSISSIRRNSRNELRKSEDTSGESHDTSSESHDASNQDRRSA